MFTTGPVPAILFNAHISNFKISTYLNLSIFKFLATFDVCKDLVGAYLTGHRYTAFSITGTEHPAKYRI